mmetsp:Transcript_7273/g.17571  ORF Transcript_7273/g.17571 Transcript_7273/m.17571 type:complete len:369 (-) Transcript_7273:368-1474(-)
MLLWQWGWNCGSFQQTDAMPGADIERKNRGTAGARPVLVAPKTQKPREKRVVSSRCGCVLSSNRPFRSEARTGLGFPVLHLYCTAAAAVVVVVTASCERRPASLGVHGLVGQAVGDRVVFPVDVLKDHVAFARAAARCLDTPDQVLGLFVVRLELRALAGVETLHLLDDQVGIALDEDLHVVQVLLGFALAFRRLRYGVQDRFEARHQALVFRLVVCQQARSQIRPDVGLVPDDFGLGFLGCIRRDIVELSGEDVRPGPGAPVGVPPGPAVEHDVEPELVRVPERRRRSSSIGACLGIFFGFGFASLAGGAAAGTIVVAAAAAAVVVAVAVVACGRKPSERRRRATEAAFEWEEKGGVVRRPGSSSEG